MSHSACQAPAGRSSPASAAATWRVAARPGLLQRGATDERGEHRVRLVRHRRRRAAGTFGELADLGSAEGEDVGGDAAPRIGAARRRVAEPGDRGSRGVPRRRGGQAQRGGQLERQRGGRADRVVEVARELDGRGQGAGGAPHLHREDERRGGVVRVEDAGQPARRLQAERRGHGVLGEGTGDHRRPAVALDQLGQQPDLLAQRGADHADGVAGAQHQGGVDDVLAGEAAVQPRGPVGADVRECGAQHVDESGGGVAAALRRGRDDGDVLGADEPLEVELGHAGRRDAGAGQRVEPRLLDGDHRREEGLVGEQVAGALVARPEEVAHRVSLACPSARGTPSRPRPGRRPADGCRTRSRGRRPRRPASPAGRRAARRAAGRGDGPGGRPG